MSHYVFYDLEETVIDAWESGSPLYDNIACICKTINSSKIKHHIGVFSYAIHDDNDINDFVSRISPLLPSMLKDDIIIPSRDDFIESGKEYGGLLIKKEMFIVYCMNTFPDGKSFHLFDDDPSVKNDHLIMHGNFIFGFTNIKDCKKPDSIVLASSIKI